MSIKNTPLLFIDVSYLLLIEYKKNINKRTDDYLNFVFL